MNEWNIQSRSHSCQICERSFADKESYHTLLMDDRLEFKRLDVCAACWEKKYGANPEQPKEKDFISYWQGVYEAPPAKPPEAIQKESAETLLRKLIEQDEPCYGPVCFILAVMLERKRLLKVKEQIRREGKRIFIYEQPKTGDLFTIVDPDLQLNQLEQVQKDVAHLLEHGLGVPVEADQPAAALPGDADAATDAAEPVAPVSEAPEAAPIPVVEHPEVS